MAGLFRSFTRRRVAGLIVVLTIVFNLVVDYQVLLANPRELEAQAKRFLSAALPGYEAKFEGPTKFNFFTGRLKLEGVTFHREGHPEQVLFSVPELTVESDELIPTQLTIRAVNPIANLEVGPEGLRGLDLFSDSDEPTTSLPLDLSIEIVGGRLRLKVDDVEGINAEVLVNVRTLPDRTLQIHRDLSAEGALGLYLGVLVPAASGSASPGGGPLGVPTGRVARHVLPDLKVEVARSHGGPLNLQATGRVLVSQTIRGLLPTEFRTGVWDEIGILRGEVDINARVVAPGEGATVDIALEPHAAAIKPKNFPVELSDITGGRFEITIAVPPQGPPAFLGVSWEHIQAKIAAERAGDPGLGQLESRGTVYPGGKGEGVSMQLLVAVKELPLAPQLVAAFPPQIRAVYQQFDPQGTVSEAHVQIFKGPEDRDALVLRDGRRIRGVLDPRTRLTKDADDNTVPSPNQPLQVGLDSALRFVTYRGEDLLLPIRSVVEVLRNDGPQISVWVPHLDGRVSACFEDVPARLNNIQGWFSLREGANVELLAEGDLELGGKARVKALVMHGDLISVDVTGRDVPVTKKLENVLPGTSKDMVAPFHLKGGSLDLHVVVSKAGRGKPVLPVVKAQLHGVSFDHDAASMPLTADGLLEVRPRFDTAEQSEPTQIDLKLDVALSGKGVTAALASGTLTLPPHQPPEGLDFSSDLSATLGSLDLGALPPPIRKILETVRPKGRALNVVARVKGPLDMRIQAKGAGLTVRPRAFDLPLRVDRFDVEVGAKRVTLHDLWAGRTTGGDFRAKGWFGLEGGPDDPPDLSLELNHIQNLPLDADFVRALPEGPREPLERLEAEGLLGGRLQLDLRRGAPANYSGVLELSKTRLTLHAIDESLQHLDTAPLSEVRGFVELSPREIVIRDMRGKVAKADMTLERGVLSLDPVKGELRGFDLSATLSNLLINARTRALAGPEAQDMFRRFRTDGPAELDLRAFRAAPEDETHLHLLARLQGARVVADLFPVPITDLRGEVRIEDGEPVLLDLAGRLSPTPLTGGFGAAKADAATIRIWRDRKQEGRFPENGKAGRVYRVHVKDFERFPLVEGAKGPASLRTRFERELKKTWRETLDHFDPVGVFDVEAWVYQPNDEEAPLRWVVEARLREGAITLVRYEDEEPPPPGERPGLGFTNLKGVARLRGTLSEMELGSCNGELRLLTADLFKQTISDLRGPLRVKQGVLSLGVAGQPFRASFYGGDFLGRTDYAFKGGAYRCSFGLGLGRGARPGRLPAMMKELDELSDEPDEGPSFPYRGRLTAKVDFDGGGPDLLGRPRPFRGRGRLQLNDSNLLETPFLKAFQTLVAKLRGSRESDPLPHLAVDFKMNERGLKLDTADLWGKDLKVHGEDGVLRYDGYVDIQVVPFDTAGALHEVLTWIPGTGYRYHGYLQEGASLDTNLNPLSTIDWFRKLMKGKNE
jgi:hypothetical protein